MKIEQNYKLRVTPEESEKVQEVCFLYGVGWLDGPYVQITEAPFLYIYEDVIRMDYILGDEWFKNHKNTEITPQDFLAKYEPPQWMKEIEDNELRKRVIENWDGKNGRWDGNNISDSFGWEISREGDNFWGAIGNKSYTCQNCTYEEFKHLDESRGGVSKDHCSSLTDLTIENAFLGRNGMIENHKWEMKKLTLDDGTECFLKDDYYLAIKTVAKELATEIHNKKLNHEN